jgi:hypothetical protein
VVHPGLFLSRTIKEIKERASKGPIFNVSPRWVLLHLLQSWSPEPR